MAFPGPRSYWTSFTADLECVFKEDGAAKEVSCESEGKPYVELLYSLHDINEP